MKSFDDIATEVEKRLKENKIPDSDKKTVETWLKFMKSDIPEMKAANAKLLSNYLKRGLGKTEEDSINYKEFKNDILAFLENNKDLDENIVNILKGYTISLNDDRISNNKKKEIYDKYWKFRRNLDFKKKGIQLIELINEKYKDDIEYKNYLYELFKIITDETKDLAERKDAGFTIDNILKYEKELTAINTANMKK